MAKRKSNSDVRKKHDFRNKLILNQWIISLFGIDPLIDYNSLGDSERPFHKLAKPINDSRMEGMDTDNIHNFFHNLVESSIFWDEENVKLTKDQLMAYEENIASHTLKLSEKRSQKLIWKYFQWLNLLFVEIYLDRYFSDRENLLNELNYFIDRFNSQWTDYADIPYYSYDDLNKICFQNATGSGKTLIMHANLLQFNHYAEKYGDKDDISRVILLTPNERLSEQHLAEFEISGIDAEPFFASKSYNYGMTLGLESVDVLEITKLAEQEGPNTIATRSLGDQNLLLVDEGHRGMSGTEEGKWFSRRAQLCEKGFTLEYSATFEQAVQASSNINFENTYAKTVIFDYSYRWFYEDGFGKDYQILNLPDSFEETRYTYMTACLLKYYQQLRLYEDKKSELNQYNIEKPLWVFVGSTVAGKISNNDEKIVASDVALIVEFIADFLNNNQSAIRRINDILTGSGQDTGLIDKNGNDIFANSFNYLFHIMNKEKNTELIYKDILKRLFNNAGAGRLFLDRIKGDSGEIALYTGTSETPFGLINVGDAKSLCDHISKNTAESNSIEVIESDFSNPMFSSVKDSGSSVNLLIGSKKFVEGWDCWRVSTMGLMHVGRTEGSQIIQLFGRGVRLKGYNWCLKRSSRTNIPNRPLYIEELETLNVFGIEADFMERFREFLKEEGLPGNEKREIYTIPLNVTYDFGKKLKILRPKVKNDGIEYSFKKDAPIPEFGEVPDYMITNRIVIDWYPRIQSVQSKNTASATQKDEVYLKDEQLSLIDYDELYFEMEQFKRERGWYNLNITKKGIKELLKRCDWYILRFPETRLYPQNYEGVVLIQRIVLEMLKKYCDHFYNYCKRKYIEPRLELRDLKSDDENIPQDEEYKLIVDGDEKQVINNIMKLQEDIRANKNQISSISDIKISHFDKHLFQPLFHVRENGKVTILPVTLNESEFQFVKDLKNWCETNDEEIQKDNREIYLLRNLSRGKGVGFFEAGNFYPDFILWILVNDKQYINFIEPHGLRQEGPGSDKVLFYRRIKEIEKRLGNPDIVLNSFILSWTNFAHLSWDMGINELEKRNVLFMKEDAGDYIRKLFDKIISPVNNSV